MDLEFIDQRPESAVSAQVRHSHWSPEATGSADDHNRNNKDRLHHREARGIDEADVMGIDHTRHRRHSRTDHGSPNSGFQESIILFNYETRENSDSLSASFSAFRSFQKIANLQSNIPNRFVELPANQLVKISG